MDRPKTELAYRVPASKFTRRKLDNNEAKEILAGLTQPSIGKTQVTMLMTVKNLNYLSTMKVGKWERPNNILNNWRVTKTTLRLGSRIIGKCMMGSTSNALDKGGDNFKKLYNSSDVTKRNAQWTDSLGII